MHCSKVDFEKTEKKGLVEKIGKINGQKQWKFLSEFSHMLLFHHFFKNNSEYFFIIFSHFFFIFLAVFSQFFSNSSTICSNFLVYLKRGLKILLLNKCKVTHLVHFIKNGQITYNQRTTALSTLYYIDPKINISSILSMD